MTGETLISVIIPAYNAARFIEAAIASVLAQQHRPIEVIVVDDGSTDPTAALAAGFGAPVRCLRQPNGGPPVARNRGLGAARGAFIGFLDADDLYEPGRIALQLAKFRQSPDLDVVIGHLLREDLVSRPGEAMAFEPIEPDGRINLHLGAALFRRSVFDRVGLLDGTLRHSDDWDWFMRAREAGTPMLIHGDTVLRQRLHDGNLTRDQAANRQFLAVMLKRSLDRRRARGERAASLPELASLQDEAGQRGARRHDG